MAKDPAFLFYPGDWLGGTMGMTFEQKGAYLHLLIVQFNRGHMTSHMVGQEIGQLFGQIEDKFVKDENGLWYNIKLDEEKNKRKAFTSSRKNNLNGVNQYTKKSAHLGGHMTSHMENENKPLVSLKVIEEKISEILNSSAWIEQIAMKFGRTSEAVKKELSDFLDMENLKGTMDREISDIRQHFINWLNTQKNKPKLRKSNPPGFTR